MKDSSGSSSDDCTSELFNEVNRIKHNEGLKQKRKRHNEIQPPKRRRVKLSKEAVQELEEMFYRNSRPPNSEIDMFLKKWKVSSFHLLRDKVTRIKRGLRHQLQDFNFKSRHDTVDLALSSGNDFMFKTVANALQVPYTNIFSEKNQQSSNDCNKKPFQKVNGLLFSYLSVISKKGINYYFEGKEEDNFLDDFDVHDFENEVNMISPPLAANTICNNKVRKKDSSSCETQVSQAVHPKRKFIKNAVDIFSEAKTTNPFNFLFISPDRKQNWHQPVASVFPAYQFSNCAIHSNENSKKKLELKCWPTNTPVSEDHIAPKKFKTDFLEEPGSTATDFNNSIKMPQPSSDNSIENNLYDAGQNILQEKKGDEKIISKLKVNESYNSDANINGMTTPKHCVVLHKSTIESEFSKPAGKSEFPMQKENDFHKALPLKQLNMLFVPRTIKPESSQQDTDIKMRFSNNDGCMQTSNIKALENWPAKQFSDVKHEEHSITMSSSDDDGGNYSSVEFANDSESIIIQKENKSLKKQPLQTIESLFLASKSAKVFKRQPSKKECNNTESLNIKREQIESAVATATTDSETDSSTVSSDDESVPLQLNVLNKPVSPLETLFSCSLDNLDDEALCNSNNISQNAVSLSKPNNDYLDCVQQTASHTSIKYKLNKSETLSKSTFRNFVPFSCDYENCQTKTENPDSDDDIENGYCDNNLYSPTIKRSIKDSIKDIRTLFAPT